MLNKEMLEMMMNHNGRPALFETVPRKIWTEPYIAKQMLMAHLDQGTDAASRRMDTIEKTVAFINRRVEKGSTILDLGCGPGLYAERLCESGHRITGIDFSENSINYARNSAKDKGLEIEYVCKSFFDMEYENCFDMAMQIYGELGTFSDEARNQLLKLINKALKPGGVFMFDVATPSKEYEPGKVERNWYVDSKGFWREGKHLVLEEKIYYENNTRLEQFTVIDEEEVVPYRNWFHDYTKETIEAAVLEAGFSKVQVAHSLFEEEDKDDTEWITIVATK